MSTQLAAALHLHRRALGHPRHTLRRGAQQLSGHIPRRFLWLT
jgi:hypothetical protein